MSAPGQRLRERLDWIPGAHRPRPRRAGLAAIAVLVLLLVVAFGGWRPWAGSGTIVRARFATAEQLVAGRTPVRIAGVQVGTVQRIERGPDGRSAIVVLQIDDRHVHVARDAGARIRLRTVLAGTRYVDLDPGSPSASALGDAVIPLARTSAQVDWDDLNQILEPDVRRGQRSVLKGLRRGLADPAVAGHALDVLGPSLAVVGRGARALRGQRDGDLPRLISATGRVLESLSRDRGALEGLVRDGARTLAVTDDHRRALGRAVALTPPALDATARTMARLDVTLRRLDPLAADLRPGVRRIAPATRVLRPALGETDRLLRAATPVLHDLPPALRNLAAMSREGVPLIDALDPTVRRLDDELLPWLRRRDDDTKLRNYEAIGPLFSVLDSAAGDYDANGWFFHFPITPTGDTVMLPCGPAVTPGQLKRCDAVNQLLGGLLGEKAKR
ncbi:putative Mce family protein [Patulibacter medicamentivorans]|uniref:Putative Mce family protein n=1 Tax=Patulibacter medicamentivorans TaxID=1097667 RepID=H0E6M6_9ACTN|nr:MlaD family protein [Patulibacter medicamentivorans]EHN10673.1 putative Mce family protein [Patulibacter medicamentivorans]